MNDRNKKSAWFRSALSVFAGVFALASLGSLGGCAAPSPITAQPMSARAAPVERVKPRGASLYSDSSYRPLFEDRKARFVGDTLTILINEKTTATKQSSASASRSSKIGADIPTIAGLPLGGLQGTSLAASSSYSQDGKGAAGMNDTFTGTITVTVVEELNNGNLLVSGEKQVSINQGVEYIRFSGVVNPSTINNNSVSSLLVADARVEYKQDGSMDSAQKAGWLSRFFLSVLPF